ncbi:hypothetical protein M430DRAFT_260728 [Amorphotheca resinae ATCC 22711]|uniref:Uncharacterized protein n=1 Tax=Amorphotheca resinae ATCC 22711 TaxID=857342 RepID=A0A2T3AVS3_AMORE|nr:hypothetical protein M430DRAFT_260728 [Amorphotheca resinae ATCC 22711]PSS12768.1 hypothetical protein M430DRAFT_260728 [Amorphotheca resinae ATCC 22711]
MLYMLQTSWWGCGNHIPRILDRAPMEQRCSCEPKVWGPLQTLSEWRGGFVGQ